MDDPCDGCVIHKRKENGIYTKTHCRALTYFKLHELENNCPCIHCIVKMICSDTCAERFYFGHEKEGFYA